MEFNSLGNMRKYFESIERRYHDGSLVPSSPEGNAERDRLVNALADLSKLIEQEQAKVISGDIHATYNMMDIINIRTGVALLIGKFEGFRYGQSYVVARACIFGEQLM